MAGDLPRDQNPAATKRLDALSVRLGKQRLAEEKAKANYDAAFETVFKVFNMYGDPEEGFEFIAADGYKLAREIAKGDPKLNPVKMLAIFKELFGENWQAFWDQVTDLDPDAQALARPINQLQLAAFIESNNNREGHREIDVNEFIDQPKPVVRHIRRKVSDKG